MPPHAGDPDWHQKELYVTFRKEISADDEANMNAIPRKQRAMVRKGIKLGLTGEIDQDVDRFFTRLLDQRAPPRHAGVPEVATSRCIKEVFGDECEIRIIVRGGELIAGVLSFYFRDEVLPYYGGGMPAARECAGNDFMYWNLMQARRRARRAASSTSAAASSAPAPSTSRRTGASSRTPLAYEYRLYASTRAAGQQSAQPEVPAVHQDVAARCRSGWPISSARTSSGTWGKPWKTCSC